MAEGTTGESRPEQARPTSPGWSRALVSALLLLSWLVLVPLLWSAFSSLPSAERLAQSRMARIPTLGGFLFTLGRSAAELLVLLALAWPRARRYATRLAVAALGLLGYFLLTAPLSLTRMEWLHRRWLALLVLLLLAALGLELLLRLRRGVGSAAAQFRTR